MPTAFVVPTSEEALIESDNADFADDEARQLVESVDANYLVLISTRPATIDNLPIDDQLTADRAQQFGSALHELGHIRYTAIANAAALLEERVDEAHQEFVHGLWNACEDAAIENQLRLDQSQIAADRIELVRRSISTQAEEYQTGESCAFTFRDAIETALYDEGIYDTGVRDALCDPDDDRIVFAGDADRQAYEQVADSISELITTVLSTPNSVERIEHILDWWESVVKPLLDPSQQNQQESGQPDPDGATGESSTDASSSDRSSGSSADGEGEKSTDESADADRSSAESEAGQTGESTPESNSSGDDPDSSSREESSTSDGMGESDESEGSGSSQAENQPNPDAINTDQRQSHPGADVLDYPDIGGDEDADALRQPGHDEGDKDEAGSNGDSEVERESADDHQATGGDRENESAADTAGDAGSEDDGRENANGVRDSDTDTSPDEGGDTDATPDSGTDAGNSEEMPGSNDGQSSQNDSSGANHSETTDVAGESDEQDSEGESERETSESQSRSQSSGNPWGPSNDTNQTSLGSFSTSESQTESGASASDSGGSDESPANESDAERDGSPTDAGDANESESESESESNESNTVGDSGNDTTDGSDEGSTDKGPNTDSAHNSESVGDEGPAESSSIEDEDGVTTSESDTPASDGDTEREDTSTETTPDANEQSPASTPDHADGDGGLDREGALETDRDAAHDEAERATPDERGLERDLEDVADALDALEEQDGGGAAPGSLSELDIMPVMEESSSKTTAERWGDAAADAEFVGGSLRKALKESHRDAHRSGVTSGTFDRRRTAALARGDVDVFQVRQPGDDKQYDLVIILDRSNSMRKHIKTAEDALVRFALACEEIGINVGVIDFINTEARLIKPFSVGSAHVRESLLSERYGGKTPLADALGLSRELLEQRRNSPLVLVVTDGKPGSADAYQDELTQSYAPVCGVTLVLDQPAGSVPERVSRNERFYDRHVYVHDPSQLANRLDQFAVMFSGL
ncbi:von Willebrand factor A [Halococcus salifodinae DSM 8989]|uniref:von Willebrand factor A n=1 Tax=Halococcus salifodinae DSM 8989 TaxID=1227456 RepID=M0ND18_9EURY|nr:von Willebrand factor A [Halococcus salifodinae DSM 8989]